MPLRPLSHLISRVLFTALCGLPLSFLFAQSVAVTTYHNDNRRTGLNPHETVLTPANVGSSSFGLLSTVALDDQVDAEPLMVPDVNITAGSSPGIHDVVYVVTENNSIYAIDAHSFAVLLSVNLGTPVPKPLGCVNNGPNVGINSTPVIDHTAKIMYVIAYTNDTAGPTYRIHALDLGSLTDKVTALVITATHTLSDGSTFTFNGKYQRQRPALLLSNGVVYAGFGSFCDYSGSLSRGWLLGWETGTLTPLAGNKLFDTQVTSPSTFFLSSIWMSGYGLTADDYGNILAVTGNSDPSGTTYDGVTNVQESAVKISSDLTLLLDLFTPMNQSHLDKTDGDFGSGGIMILPDQKGSIPHLAVAAGKSGTLFLMNADKLGGYSSSSNNVLGSYSVGACWCGPSYFVDSDGVARVVSSGGKTAKVWRLSSASGTPALTNTTSSASIGGGQEGGFLTSVSSNGKTNAIIWALSHPTSKDETINLFAFNPDAGGSTMTQLFKGAAGSWASYYGQSNLVPMVANGQVYVATNKQLQVFGILPSGRVKEQAAVSSPSKRSH
jgi:hypothetical protein